LKLVGYGGDVHVCCLNVTINYTRTESDCRVRLYRRGAILTAQAGCVPHSTAVCHTVLLCAAQYRYVPHSTAVYHTVPLCTAQYRCVQ
jgi:hypothetical protein